jgi:L-alanine-DL-glutamate epimerase-like enolase superfamily enzyme
MEWELIPVKLALKYTWKISRNSSVFKQNFIVQCKHNGMVGMGEVAPNIRYQETPESIVAAFQDFKLTCSVISIENWDDFERNLFQSQLPNALQFGIEAAYVNLLAQTKKQSIPAVLGIPTKKQIGSCYTLPMMETLELAAFYEQHQLGRFPYIKVKVNAAKATEIIEAVASFCKQPILIDGNEAWENAADVIAFLKTVEKHQITFIEQPLPAHFIDEYKILKRFSPVPVFADESVLNKPDFDLLVEQFHGINMKLMKAGSYVNGIRIINEAKQRNLQTMVGCMVETTLGIQGAFYLAALTDYADLDGCLIVADEPYHLLKESNGLFELASN